MPVHKKGNIASILPPFAVVLPLFRRPADSCSDFLVCAIVQHVIFLQLGGEHGGIRCGLSNLGGRDLRWL